MVTYSNKVPSWQNPYYEYRGLSTDTKTTDAPENSIFWELDTGMKFYFSSGVWQPAQLPSENGGSAGGGGANGLVVVLSRDENDNTNLVGNATFGEVYAAVKSCTPVVLVSAEDAGFDFAGLVLSGNNFDSVISIYFFRPDGSSDFCSGASDDPISMPFYIDDDPT